MYDKQDYKDKDAVDLGIKHHFSDDIYAKEMHLPSGNVALSHKHKYSHLSVLAVGECRLPRIIDDEEVVDTLKAPAVIEIKANIEHEVLAIKDVTWLCIHATKERDVNKIDEVLIASV